MTLEEALKTKHFQTTQQRASLNILYTAYWVKTQLNQIVKPHGLTLEQFNVMRILRGQMPQPVCIKEIASRMVERASNVPRIVDKLVLKNLVERSHCPTDKRETHVYLTEIGMKLLEKVSQELDQKTVEIIGLDEHDAFKLNRLLEKLRENKPPK